MPVPGVAVLPANVAVVRLHNAWSGPAFELINESTCTIIVSRDLHAPKVIVQIKALSPKARLVTAVVADDGDAIVDVPVVLQAPTPNVGTLPVIDVNVTLQKTWSAPATEVEGFFTIITIVSRLTHAPFVIVQTK